jgi:lipopolysaccharide export LptBFGC system permease protein LptF
VGGQLACLVSVLVGFLYQVAQLRHLTSLDLTRYGKIFLQAAGISLIGAVIYLGVRSYAVLARPIPNILAGAVVLVVAYGLSAWFFLRNNQKEIA